MPIDKHQLDERQFDLNHAQGEATTQTPGKGQAAPKTPENPETPDNTPDPYQQFQGNNYDQVINYIQQQIQPQETHQQRIQRERREKQQAFLASIADGIATFHTAYANARGTTPIQLPNMSQTTQQRFDKANAQREQNKQQQLNYYLNIAKLQDQDRNFKFSLLKEQIAEQHRQKKEQLDALKNEAYRTRLLAQTETDEARKKYYETQADIKERLADGMITKQQAETELLKAKTRLADRSKGTGSTGTAKSSKGLQDYTITKDNVYDMNGKIVKQNITRKVNNPQATNKKTTNNKKPTGISWK